MTAKEFIDLGLQKGDHVRVTLTYNLKTDCVFVGLKTFKTMITDPDNELLPEFRTIGKRGGPSRELALPGTKLHYIESVIVLKKKDGTPAGDLWDRAHELKSKTERFLVDAKDTILNEFRIRGIENCNLMECGVDETLYVDKGKILKDITVKDGSVRLSYLDTETNKTDWWPLTILDLPHLSKILFWVRGILMIVDARGYKVEDGEILQKEPDYE